MDNNLNSASHTLQPNVQRLIFINMVVATFVLLANGSALFLGLTGKAPEVLADLLSVILILIGAMVVLVAAVLAVLKPDFGQKALSVHAVSLTAGAIMLLLWGLSLALHSANELVDPSRARVTWSVGWLTALASYSAYLMSNTFLLRIRNHSIVVRYAYLWVGVLVFFIDVFVFFRLAASVTQSM
jgi:hypothetical protein